MILISFSWPRHSSECLLAAFISYLPSHLSFPTSWLPLLLTPESLRASSLASGPFLFWTRKHHRTFDILNSSIWGHSWFSCNMMSVLTINFELYPFSFLFAFSTKRSGYSGKSFFFFFFPAPEQLAHFLAQRTFLSICIPWMIKWLAKLNECVSSLYNWMIHFWAERLCVCCVLSCVNCVRVFATPCAIACQAPLSIGFSKQEYCSGLPLPSAGIFPTQGWNLGFLHCR